MARQVRKPLQPLPGDVAGKALIDRVLRVNLAGEYAAQWIYEGQLAVLKDKRSAPAIAHMAEQEAVHLATFQKLLAERRARPSALYPLWRVASFALGAGTALLGEKAAMACTVAVEEVIDEHYRAQQQALPASEKKLKATIERFRKEELEHRDTGLDWGAEEAPAYRLLHKTIRGACKAAIKVAERV